MEKNKIVIRSKQRSELMARNAALVNKAKRPDGYIYVIRFGKNDLFKFGVSSNPNMRIRDIDSASPVPIIEMGRFYFKNVYEMEEMIHDNLNDVLVRREWFKLSDSEVISLCEQIKEMSNEGTYLTKKDGST